MATKILRLLILVLVVLSAHADAQPSGRLDSLRTRALSSMNLPSTGTALVTTAMVSRIVNQSIGTVCNDFVDAYQKYDTVSLTGAVEGAALNNDCLSVVRVWRMMGDSIRIPLYNESLYTGKASTVEGSKQTVSDQTSPQYYRVVGATISTFPKYMEPAGFTCQLLVQYQAADRQLSADSMSTAIAGDYRDALDWLILSNLYSLRSMYGDAGWWMAKYQQKKGVVVTK